jgi:hypothetical protein
VTGTLLAAVIYLAIGAVTGALVTSPVNGTVLIFFIWAADVFSGPSFGSADRHVPWAFPTQFLIIWMTRLPAGLAGPGRRIGLALAWTAVAAALDGAVLTAAIRTAATPGQARCPASSRRAAGGPAGHRPQPGVVGAADYRPGDVRVTGPAGHPAGLQARHAP